ncbi:MAG: hypothetical protein ACR2NA_12815 [Solirubrobacterales bacterium]
MNAVAAVAYANLVWAAGGVRRRLADPRGQGTVEYVGLILLVALLMVGMIKAMGSFNGEGGKDLALAITQKIKQAIQKVTFR